MSVRDLFSEEFDGCGELVLELFKGTYDIFEFVDGEEMTELWKRLDNGELVRFQVFKTIETSEYSAYLYYEPGYPEEVWTGLDLAEAVPVWIDFCKRQALKPPHSN